MTIATTPTSGTPTALATALTATALVCADLTVRWGWARPGDDDWDWRRAASGSLAGPTTRTCGVLHACREGLWALVRSGHGESDDAVRLVVDDPVAYTLLAAPRGATVATPPGMGWHAVVRECRALLRALSGEVTLVAALPAPCGPGPDIAAVETDPILAGILLARSATAAALALLEAEADRTGVENIDHQMALIVQIERIDALLLEVRKPTPSAGDAR